MDPWADPRLKAAEDAWFQAVQAAPWSECALRHYRTAAEGYRVVATTVPLSMPKSYGRLIVSAVCLAVKAEAFGTAVSWAKTYLADAARLDPWALGQLRVALRKAKRLEWEDATLEQTRIRVRANAGRMLVLGEPR